MADRKSYTEVLKNFYELLDSEHITPAAQLLFLHMLEKFNKAFWVEELHQTAEQMNGRMNLTPYQFRRAKNELEELGLIECKIVHKKYTIWKLGVKFRVQNSTPKLNLKPQIKPNLKLNLKPQVKLHTSINTDTDINKKKINKEKSIDDVLNEIGSEELKTALRDFLKMRAAIKKPCTTKALELIIDKLYKLSGNTSEQVRIVNQSVLHSWQGVFPLHEDSEKDYSVDGLFG